MIFHIAEEKDWQRVMQDEGQEVRYEAPSFKSEGFIHCSEKHQLARVANARFQGREDLVLLTIDPEAVCAEIRYENLEGGTELFPHIYGPLERQAVSDARPFRPGSNGLFSL